MSNPSYAEWIRTLEADDRALVAVEHPQPAIAVVRMQDPENMNALSGVLTVQLHRALAGVMADPTVRVVVLTGTEDVFSVGGDWRLMRDRAHTYAERDEGTTGLWQWIRYQFGGIARLIVQSDKVVVAAICGPAAGVALAWALNSDLIVAAEDARLVTAFGRIGLVPEVGTNWALTRRLGYARAFELFVTGKILSGTEARDLGLINAAVARQSVMSVAQQWCESVCALPAHVVAMTKPLMRGAADMSWHHAILAEEFAEPNTFTTRAHQDSVNAFLARSARE